jgi:hypothetical protein
MTTNEENFIEDLRSFLLSQGVELVATDVTSFSFKGLDIFIDIEDVYEEL